MHWTGITPEQPIGAVDSHAHLFRRDLPMLAGRRHTPEVDALLSDYLALLDAHHLTHGLLVQPSFLGEDNSFMLAALQACPQRLRGVAVLAPTVNEVELAALAAAGICGIRLNLLGLALPELADADWQRWFGLLRELGVSGQIRSPSYALLETYEAGGWQVLHLDLYRLLDPEELENLGVRDYHEGRCLWLVEWPGKGEGYLPRADVRLDFQSGASEHTLTLTAQGDAGTAWIAALKPDPDS